MEPTLKELEEMYDSVLIFNEDIQKAVDFVLGETQALDGQNWTLSLRKRKVFDSIWELNAQYQNLHEIYVNFQNTKEKNLANMRQRISELKLNMAAKQEQLANLVNRNCDPDFEVKSKCRCDAGHDSHGQTNLVYIKVSNIPFEFKFNSRPFLTNSWILLARLT